MDIYLNTVSDLLWNSLTQLMLIKEFNSFGIVEEIILTVRKHWFALILPILGSMLIFSFGTMLIGIFSFIPAVLWVVYKILERKSNIWIVTNLRVIGEYGVFSLISKETPFR